MSKTMAENKIKNNELTEAMKSLPSKEFAYVSPNGKDWRFNAVRANVLWEGEYSKVKNPHYVKPVVIKDEDEKE